MTKEPFADRFYRALLRLLPLEFRTEFGPEMREVFREQRRDTSQSGRMALLRMWSDTILDLFRMAPREHWSVLSADAKYALRMMQKSPGSTFAAILILGLAIGANTAIFSVVHSVLLKSLPYINGDRLAVLRHPETKLGNDDAFFSVGEIQDLRQSRTLDKVVEYHTMTFTLYGRGEAHQVRAGIVSSDFFNVFGLQPLLGRTFVGSDDRPGAEPVLVLSYEFWQQVESGDPNIVGKRYEMNDRIHTVIGVLPSIPQYPDENDVYMPTSSCPMRANEPMMAPRDARMMKVFATLKEGQTLQQAAAEMSQMDEQFQIAYPEAYEEKTGMFTTVGLLRDALTKQAKPLILLLWGATGFVLLIACANVANLILARMSSREQELLVRTAIGASSSRLLRQLLTESFFLALFASILGLIVAYASVELMKDFAGQITSRAREITIDQGVLAFTVLCASITTVFFGSIAGIYSRQDLSSGLKEGGRSGTHRGSNFVRKFLVTAQVAFCCVLLIGAGLMVRSFLNLTRVPPGFSLEKIFAVNLDYNGSQFQAPEKRMALADRVQENLMRIPGVVSVGLSSSYPMDQENMIEGRPIRFRVEGDPRPESESPIITTMRSASVDYFHTLGVRLIAGRIFLDSDTTESPPVVVLNQRLARQRWGKETPIGKRITFDNGQTWMTVVGIVADVKEFGLGTETPYQVYRPLRQRPFLATALIRTADTRGNMVDQIRRTLHRAEPQMAIVRIQTMEQVRARSIESPRNLTQLFSLFAALALILSIAGIASMLSLWVKQQTRETGIRMALGATPEMILTGTMGQGLRLVVLGILAGLAGALVLTPSLQNLLFQVTNQDIATYLLAVVLLVIAAIIACYLPARRAARIDPHIALHTE